MSECVLCKSSEDNYVLYGEMLKKKEMAVHTFCLYLSSNLCQRDGVDEGFLGFSLDDIKLEVRRVSKLTCCYCSKRYASIGCCEVKCRRSFHLACGIRHHAQNQFVGTFNSFCHQHVVDKCCQRPQADEKCYICYEGLTVSERNFNRENILLAPCCKNGWFHKFCLQKFAISAGVFFKCPLCNDTRTFCTELPYIGIFIPQSDAAWELDSNAYAELLERPNSCAAAECVCAGGRNESSNRNPLLICNACGSIAMHKHCLPAEITATNFFCNDCILINSSDRKTLPEPGEQNNHTEGEADIEVESQSSGASATESRIESSEDEEDEIIRRPKNSRSVMIIYDEDDDDENEIRPWPQTTQRVNLVLNTEGFNNNSEEISVTVNNSEIIVRSRIGPDCDSDLSSSDQETKSDEENIKTEESTNLEPNIITISHSEDEEEEPEGNFQPSVSNENTEQLNSPRRGDDNDSSPNLNCPTENHNFQSSEEDSEDNFKISVVISKKRAIYDDSDSSSDDFKGVAPYSDIRTSFPPPKKRHRRRR